MPHVDILCNQIQARGIDTSEDSKAIQAFKASDQVARNDCSPINVTEHSATTTRSWYTEKRNVVGKKICNVILSREKV